MQIRNTLGLTFDDVLLVPKRSAIASRSAVDTSSHLTRRLNLAIPLISANMDTVTEANMAIAMAQAGGLGAIHRFMTVERQAAEVARVKRAESFVVESPATIPPNSTVTHARQLLAELGIGGLLVTDTENRLLGMLTNRDVLLAPDPLAAVSTVMTPRQQLVTLSACGSQGDDLEHARTLLHTHRIEKLPLINEYGETIGLVTAQDIIKLEQYPHATKDSKGRLCVAAHGHSDHAIQVVHELKQSFPQVDIIAGNVATAQGVLDLAQAGADAVKVGVGSGSICTTRIVTGFGVPQLTAIMDCAAAARQIGIPLIADGGIRNGGDLTKALAAGADTAMIGSMLAGTEESPGASVVRDGRRYKIVRGMASLSANIERKMVEKGGEVDLVDWEQVVPEGVEALVPYRGAVVDLLHQLVGGLRSGMSYAGASTLAELQVNAEFIRITGAGMRESGTHDVEKIG
jgi:IMP dehydrogenase